MSYREKIYIFRKAMERGLCRISNIENLTTTGRAIAMLMTEIKIEKRYGNIGADVHMYTVQGGGATLWQKIGPLRGEGPRGQYLFCTYFKSVVIHVAFFVVHICTTI